MVCRTKIEIGVIMEADINYELIEKEELEARERVKNSPLTLFAKVIIDKD